MKFKISPFLYLNLKSSIKADSNTIMLSLKIFDRKFNIKSAHKKVQQNPNENLNKTGICKMLLFSSILQSEGKYYQQKLYLPG